MIENVYQYHIAWTNSEFSIKFTDLFGDGEAYWFTPEDARNLYLDLGLALQRYEEGQ